MVRSGSLDRRAVGQIGDRRKQILELLLRGNLTFAEIGRRLSCSRERVRQVARRFGLPSQKGWSRWSEGLKEEMKRMVLEGKSNREIYNLLGIDPRPGYCSALRKIRKELGIPSPRKVSCRVPPDLETVKSLLSEGWTAKQIAEVFKVSRNTILLRKRKLGLTRERTKEY
jgi:DNA-binding CsgD family transcriptional regulator